MAEDADKDADKDIQFENRWRERFSQAARYHEEYFGNRIDRIARFDRGDQWEGQKAANEALDQIVVNLVWANRRTVVPQIFYSRPEISVTPLTDRIEAETPDGQVDVHDVVRAAELVKPVLEQKLDQIRWKWHVRECVRDAYLFGLGWAKLGWGSQYGTLGRRPIEKDDGVPGELDVRTPVTGWSMSVHPDQPWVLRVHPQDIVLPPETRSHDEVAWIAHRFRRRVEDVKSDTRYDKDAAMQVGPTSVYSASDRREEEHERERYVQDEYVEIVELHYRDAAQPDKYEMDRGMKAGDTVFRIVTFAEGGKGILLHALDGIGMEIGRLPFYELVYANDTDRPYPQSDIGQVLDQQMELNKYRSHTLEVTKRQNAPILYDGATFPDPEKEEQFLRGEPMRAIKVNNPQGVNVPQMPALTRDHYACEERLISDFQRVAGVGENQQGVPTGGTATEASIVQSNLNVRTQDMLEITRDFCVQTIDGIFILVSNRTSIRETVRIEGPKGAEWRKWKGSDVRGHYRFSIDITQMQPPNSAVRKKMAIDLLNLSATPAVAPHIVLPKLVRQVFKAFEDVLPNVDELLKENEEPRQEAEILGMMNGQPAAVEAHHDHRQHRFVLAQFMASPAFGQLVPQAQQLIVQHDQQHQMFEQQLYGQAPAGGMGSPMEGQGAIPAMMANKTPTESSLMAGAAGGRMPGAM